LTDRTTVRPESFRQALADENDFWTSHDVFVGEFAALLDGYHECFEIASGERDISDRRNLELETAGDGEARGRLPLERRICRDGGAANSGESGESPLKRVVECDDRRIR